VVCYRDRVGLGRVAYVGCNFMCCIAGVGFVCVALACVALACVAVAAQCALLCCREGRLDNVQGVNRR